MELCECVLINGRGGFLLPSTGWELLKCQVCMIYLVKDRYMKMIDKHYHSRLLLILRLSGRIHLSFCRPRTLDGLAKTISALSTTGEDIHATCVGFIGIRVPRSKHGTLEDLCDFYLDKGCSLTIDE